MAQKDYTGLTIYTTKQGHYILDFNEHRYVGSYDEIKHIEKYYLVIKQGREGLLDSRLHELYPPEYDRIALNLDNDTPWLRERVNLVKNGKSGVGTLEGELITPCIWDKASVGDSGRRDFIRVKLNGKYGAVDLQKNIIVEPVWNELLGVVTDKLILARHTQNGKTLFGLCDISERKTLIEAELDDVKTIAHRSEYVITSKDGRQGLFDVKALKYVYDPCICSIDVCADEIHITSDDEKKSIKI